MFLEMFMNESMEPSMGYSELDDVEAAPVDESLDVDAQWLQFELENEQNWNAYVMGLIQTENAALKEGVEVEAVLEAVDFEKMRDKFEKWLRTAWSKCKAAFEKAIKKLDEFVTQSKKVIAAANALPSKAKSVKIAKVKLHGVDGFSAKEADALFTDYFTGNTANSDKILNFSDYGSDTACEKILDLNNFEAGDGREKLKKEYHTPEEAKDLTVEEALAYVKGGRATAAIKKAADKAKKRFEDLIKGFSKSKRALKRSGNASDKLGMSKAVKVLSKQQKVARQNVAEINKISRLMCGYANHDYNICIMVLRRAVGTKAGGSKAEDLKQRANIMGKKGDEAVASEGASFLDNVEFI